MPAGATRVSARLGLLYASDLIEPAADEEAAVGDAGDAPNGKRQLAAIGELQIDALALKQRLGVQEAEAATDSAGW